MSKSDVFHPLEISISGYSGSGKTTLLGKLVRHLSPYYKVGFFKSDAHRFQMDKEGKDTHTLYASGANHVAIEDPSHWAVVARGEMEGTTRKALFATCDFVFVEGRKQSSLPKLVMVDEKREILDKIADGSIQNVVALAGSETSLHVPGNWDIPYFCRDDVEGLTHFLLKFLKNQVESRPLKGLVLTGGQSRRMQTDKALLRYGRQKTQAEWAFELLRQRCDEVYLSARNGQWEGTRLASLPQIHDRFLDMGPLGGILSAMWHDSGAAWMVVACDLPFLEPAMREKLLQERDPLKEATAFWNEQREWSEPLCTVYESRARTSLMRTMETGRLCPRQALKHMHVQHVDPPRSESLKNVNHPEEYKAVTQQIGKEV